MSIYAKINSENIVENVIIADASYISTQEGVWIEVTDSTRQANSGNTYSPEAKKFISEKPFESWVLDNTSLEWVSPEGPRPATGEWRWNETDQEWVEVVSGIIE
jgi:hypothetical protein